MAVPVGDIVDARVVTVVQYRVEKVTEGELALAVDHHVNGLTAAEHAVGLVGDVVTAEDDHGLRVRLLDRLGDRRELVDVPSQH